MGGLEAVLLRSGTQSAERAAVAGPQADPRLLYAALQAGSPALQSSSGGAAAHPVPTDSPQAMLAMVLRQVPLVIT